MIGEGVPHAPHVSAQRLRDRSLPHKTGAISGNGASSPVKRRFDTGLQ
jgi:hypothetical protein